MIAERFWFCWMLYRCIMGSLILWHERSGFWYIVVDRRSILGQKQDTKMLIIPRTADGLSSTISHIA